MELVKTHPLRCGLSLPLSGTSSRIREEVVLSPLGTQMPVNDDTDEEDVVEYEPTTSKDPDTDKHPTEKTNLPPLKCPTDKAQGGDCSIVSGLHQEGTSCFHWACFQIQIHPDSR